MDLVSPFVLLLFVMILPLVRVEATASEAVPAFTWSHRVIQTLLRAFGTSDDQTRRLGREVLAGASGMLRLVAFREKRATKSFTDGVLSQVGRREQW